MPMLYGDSYGDLGRQDLQHDAARDSRYFQLLQDARNQEAANRRAQEHADSVGLQMAQLGLSTQENNANRALAFQNHNDSTDYQNRQLSQNSDLFRQQLAQGLKIAQMNLDAATGRTGDAERDKVYNEAYQAIGQGAIQTPDELQAFAGNKLHPEDFDRLSTWIQRGFDQRKAAYDQGNRASQTLNEEMSRRLAPLQPAYDKALEAIKGSVPAHTLNPTTWFRPTTESAVQAAPIQFYNLERDKFMDEVNKAKPYQNVVTYDPQSQKFQSMIPAPKAFGTNTLDTPNRVPMLPPDASTRAAAAGSALPADSWVPVPSAGIKVHPGVWNVIKQTAATIPNPADRAAYLSQAVAKAVQDRNALPLAPVAPTNQSSAPSGMMAVPYGIGNVARQFGDHPDTGVPWYGL